ncbi:putative copia-type protein [Senna tora]|uniref:Putative copia-type protein n=1 Tax=Senna tora TaxID=362788 RepID=A0A834SHZ0_9FABA|nr:putative copia-type protein [Senna tora]
MDLVVEETITVVEGLEEEEEVDLLKVDHVQCAKYVRKPVILPRIFVNKSTKEDNVLGDAHSPSKVVTPNTSRGPTRDSSLVRESSSFNSKNGSDAHGSMQRLSREGYGSTTDTSAQRESNASDQSTGEDVSSSDGPNVQVNEKTQPSTQHVMTTRSRAGPLYYFLRLGVQRDHTGPHLNQGKYALDVLKKLGMADCAVVPKPMVTGRKFTAEDGVKMTDPTVYRRAIGEDFVVKTRHDVAAIAPHYQANLALGTE